MIVYIHYMKDKIKTGITFSTFDLLHAGHITMLKEAKQQCDHLICGLHVDPQIERPHKNSPVQSVVERYIQLSAVEFVDEVIPYCIEKDLYDILLTYPIDVRIIGDDYKDVEFSGKQLCIDQGIDIYYNSRSHDFSSSGLRKEVAKREQENARKTIESQSSKDN